MCVSVCVCVCVRVCVCVCVCVCTGALTCCLTLKRFTFPATVYSRKLETPPRDERLYDLSFIKSYEIIVH